jgi:hypothetical protein
MVYVVSGVTTTQAVASNSAPIANANATDALRAMAAGAPLKIIMVGVDQFQHLFVARPGIKSPKDMKGKRIAVAGMGRSRYQTRFLVRQWGMDRTGRANLQINMRRRAAWPRRRGRRRRDGWLYPRGQAGRPQRHFDLSTIRQSLPMPLWCQHSLIKERPGW